MLPAVTCMLSLGMSKNSLNSLILINIQLMIDVAYIHWTITFSSSAVRLARWPILHWIRVRPLILSCRVPLRILYVTVAVHALIVSFKAWRANKISFWDCFEHNFCGIFKIPNYRWRDVFSITSRAHANAFRVPFYLFSETS